MHSHGERGTNPPQTTQTKKGDNITITSNITSLSIKRKLNQVN
jgi:hypothetical protein